MQPVSGEPDVTGLHVLIVEDQPELRDLYTEYVRDAGDVTAVGTGAAALDALTPDTDVVILDRRLTDTDGASVLRAIRDRRPQLPIALVTAVGPDDSVKNLGFDAYLLKPVDHRTFVSTVARLGNRTRFDEASQSLFRDVAHRAAFGGMSAIRDDPSDTDTTAVLSGADAPPIVTGLTPDPDERADLLEAIAEHPLPPVLDQVLEPYLELPIARPRFMWQWVHRLAPQNTLPCVPVTDRPAVATNKTLLILFVTILDDVLENVGDRETFDRLAGIPERRSVTTTDDVDDQTVAVAETVWNAIQDRIKGAPLFERYDPLFRFDVRQAVSAVEYSRLVIEHPELATMADLERYESHNMVMLAYADIDLMHAETPLPSPDLQPLRNMVLEAQRMARIGNWVSTWERELVEGDFSAGPLVYAVDRGLVTVDDLRAAAEDPDTARRLIHDLHEHGVEQHFLHTWERSYHQLDQLNARIESLDLTEFIDGTEEILRYHLASRGLK